MSPIVFCQKKVLDNKGIIPIMVNVLISVLTNWKRGERMEDNTRISSLLKMVDIRIRQDLDARNQDLHISSSQMRTLSYLIANTDHEINPRDLEQYFRISKPTVAGILKRLEEKGFLHYEESSKDLRYKQIVLDEPAYRCIAQLRHNFGEMESKLYAGFSQDEQDQLKALLLRLLENISE